MWEPIVDPRYSEMKKAHMPTHDKKEEISTAVRSVEAETGQGSPLSYIERDTGQAAINITRETEQLDVTTRLYTQSRDMTR